MKPFFSVVIPLFNKEKFIEKAIQCVLQQSFSDFEIIVVNDGSTDNSLVKVQAFNNKRIKVFTQENAGVSAARNYAIEKANGHFIALLDADDYWENNHLQALKDAIDAFPKAGLYCTNYNTNVDGINVKKNQFNFLFDKEIVEIPDFFIASIFGFVSHSSASTFRKTDFLALGGYANNIKSGEDSDLWIRFGLHHKVVFNPTVTMCYSNFDSTSLSKSSELLHDIYTVVSSYKEIEKNNASLKSCLDANRYALAMQCKLHTKLALYQKVTQEIDVKNLNFRQKLLLTLPKSILLIMKKAQQFLVKKRIYLSAFK